MYRFEDWERSCSFSSQSSDSSQDDYYEYECDSDCGRTGGPQDKGRCRQCRLGGHRAMLPLQAAEGDTGINPELPPEVPDVVLNADPNVFINPQEVVPEAFEPDYVPNPQTELTLDAIAEHNMQWHLNQPPIPLATLLNPFNYLPPLGGLWNWNNQGGPDVEVEVDPVEPAGNNFTLSLSDLNPFSFFTGPGAHNNPFTHLFNSNQDVQIFAWNTPDGPEVEAAGNNFQLNLNDLNPFAYLGANNPFSHLFHAHQD